MDFVAHLPFRRAWRILVSSALAVLLVVTMLIAVTPTPARAAENWGTPVHHGISALKPCADIVVIGVRGSGQTSDQQAGFGAQVGEFRDGLRERIGDQRTVRQVQIDYLSHPVWAAVVPQVLDDALVNSFLYSIGDGTTALHDVVDDSLERCPGEQIILIGYSQGALVAHQVAAVQARDERFAGVALIADPGRNSAEGVPAVGSARPGTGLTGWAGDVSALPLDSMLSATVSVCNDGDVVCDTKNDERPYPHLAGGLGVHTDSYHAAALTPAIDRIADRALAVPVPQRSTFDVPIGAPFSVGIPLKPLGAGVSAEWQLDPNGVHPSGITVSPDGTIAGQTAQQGRILVPLRVRTPGRPWLGITIELRSGAGEHCPTPDDLLELTATPPVTEIEWEGQWTPGSSAGSNWNADPELPEPIHPAASNAADAAPAVVEGVSSTTAVSLGTSERREERVYLNGQRLASPAGQIAGSNRVYLSGKKEMHRRLADDSIWQEHGIWPSWLRGSRLTGLIGGEDPSVLWEALQGGGEGQAAVRGTFLTASATGWYEWYRWPDRFDCTSDGSVVIRQVTATHSGVSRTNIATVPQASAVSRPLLAESDSQGNLALVIGTESAGTVSSAQVLHLGATATTTRAVGAIESGDLVALSDPAEWLAPEPQLAQLAVHGTVIGLRLNRFDLAREVASQPEWEWGYYPSRGDGVRTATAYRFEPGQSPRAWGATLRGQMVVVDDEIVFEGPQFGSPSVGRRTGPLLESTLVDSNRGGLARIMASDGSNIFSVPNLNGPLTEPWVGDDTVLYGFVYRQSTSIGVAERVFAFPRYGHAAQVFGVRLSEDRVNWIDDTVEAGARFSAPWLRAAGGVESGPASADGPALGRAVEGESAGWRRGDVTLSFSDDPETTQTSLIARRGSAEIWRRDVSNNRDTFSVRGDNVVLHNECRVIDLATGDENPAYALGERLGVDEWCWKLDIDGEQITWLTADGALFTAGATGPRRLIAQLEGGSPMHLSVEGGTLLVVSRPEETHGELRAFAADLSDPARPSALIAVPELDEALSIAPGAPDMEPVLARSGDRFAIFSLTHQVDGSAYDRGLPDDGPWYDRSRIDVFSLSRGGPVARLEPSLEQMFFHRSFSLDLRDDILAWTNGRGGVSLSRLDASALAPSASTRVELTGAAVPGGSLHAAPALAESPEDVRYSWYRDGALVPGAVGPELTLLASDVGAQYAVQVRYRSAGTHYSGISRPSAVVSAPLRTLRTSAPSVVGRTQVGSTLSARPGAWTTGTRFAYQWYANGRAVPGATTSQFRLPQSVMGARISVRVTGAQAGYESVARTSSNSTRVQGLLTASKPRISGVAKVGKRLTARPGQWTSGTRLSYRWYANGKPIPRATGKTYKVARAQTGKRIQVRVTGTKSGYVTLTKASGSVRIRR